MTEIVEKPKPVRGTAKAIAWGIIRHENGILAIILVAIVAAMGVLSKGLAVTRLNLTNIILQSSTRGLAAIGQTFVILTAGIDVSVGGLSLLAMICGASLMRGVSEYTLFYEPQAANVTNPALGIGVLILVGLGVGLFNGVMVSRVGMPGLIVTLAMWRITQGLGFIVSHGETIGNLPGLVDFIGKGHIAGVPVPIIIFVASVVIAYFVLHHTSFGRAVYAVGGNPVSAWLCGINVRNLLLFTYVISGFCAAIAGMIIMGRLGSASLAAASGLEIDSIAAVTIGGVSLMGGRGTIIGALLGVLILGTISNGMNILNIDPALQGVVKGVIIIVAVAIDYIRRR